MDPGHHDKKLDSLRAELAAQDAVSEAVERFRATNTRIYVIARRMTADLNRLAAIANHAGLFCAVALSRCTFKFDIGSAIFALKACKVKSILIHFPEIDTYGIFTEEQYAKFAATTRGEDRMGKIVEIEDISIYQVVIASTTQKLAVACSSREHHAKLIKCLETHFRGVAVSTSNDHFIVDVRANTEDELVKLWESLYKFASENDPDVHEHLQQIAPKMCDGVAYRDVDVMQTLRIAIRETLAEIMPGDITINVHGDNNTVVGVQHDGNIAGNGAQIEVVNQVADPQNGLTSNQVAEIWARQNRPAPGEVIKKYLERYNLENPDHEMSMVQFGKATTKMLDGLGYHVVRRVINKNTERVWETMVLKEIK